MHDFLSFSQGLQHTNLPAGFNPERRVSGISGDVLVNSKGETFPVDEIKRNSIGHPVRHHNIGGSRTTPNLPPSGGGRKHSDPTQSKPSTPPTPLVVQTITLTPQKGQRPVIEPKVPTQAKAPQVGLKTVNMPNLQQRRPTMQDFENQTRRESVSTQFRFGQVGNRNDDMMGRKMSIPTVVPVNPTTGKVVNVTKQPALPVDRRPSVVGLQRQMSKPLQNQLNQNSTRLCPPRNNIPANSPPAVRKATPSTNYSTKPPVQYGYVGNRRPSYTPDYVVDYSGGHIPARSVSVGPLGNQMPPRAPQQQNRSNFGQVGRPVNLQQQLQQLPVKSAPKKQEKPMEIGKVEGSSMMDICGGRNHYGGSAAGSRKQSLLCPNSGGRMRRPSIYELLDQGETDLVRSIIVSKNSPNSRRNSLNQAPQ